MIMREIVYAIERCIGGKHSLWTVGITNDPSRRKDEHENPKDWHYWDAQTESIARNIEAYFLDKGCKGGGGGGYSPSYVYIF